MSLSRNSILIYRYLVQEVLPSKRVVTYGEVSSATGVPLGVAGGAVAKALYEIFRVCDDKLLPPLSAIVVQEDNLYDPTRKHGMPGGGYLVAEAESENHPGRRRDNGWERWRHHPRPADTETWKMQEMIEAHQELVWGYQHPWPETL
jgi:hypothetical protein